MLSREQVLALMRERVHHPAGMRELLQVLKVQRDERTSFKRHIKSLVASGDLIHIRGHRFGLPEKMDLYVGRLQTHPAGYGFVTPERPLESGGGDIYIAGTHLNEAMHGDRVVVRIERIKDGGRAEGRIIRILERSNQWLVGRYDRDDTGMGYVVPFDPEWFAPHLEFRFPKLGEFASAGVHVTLRSALEPWHVMGEEGSAGCGGHHRIEAAPAADDARQAGWAHRRQG